MAKNYTLREAIEVLHKGTDLEAIMDITKRYPFVTVKASKLLALAGVEFEEFVKYLPEHTTANKFNAAVKKNLEESGIDEDEIEDVEDLEDDEEEEVTPSKPIKKTKNLKKSKKPEPVDEDDSDEDLMNLPAKKLYKMCVDAGLEPSKNRVKEYYIKLLNSADGEDEEEEVEEPKSKKRVGKKEKTKATKPSKKAAKKEEPEEEDWDDEEDDEEDDWDI